MRAFRGSITTYKQAIKYTTVVNIIHEYTYRVHNIKIACAGRFSSKINSLMRKRDGIFLHASLVCTSSLLSRTAFGLFEEVGLEELISDTIRCRGNLIKRQKNIDTTAVGREREGEKTGKPGDTREPREIGTS